MCRSALPLLLLTQSENRLVSPESSKISLSLLDHGRTVHVGKKQQFSNLNIVF